MNHSRFYNSRSQPGNKWMKLGSAVANMFSLWSVFPAVDGKGSYARIPPGTKVLLSRDAVYEVQPAGNLVRLNKPWSRKRLRRLAAA